MAQVQVVDGKIVHWRLVIQSWMHSRKATLLLVTFTAATAALWAGKLNGDQWITLVKWAVPAYMAANVVDGAAGVFKKTDDN